ncbi:DUF6220 domain-containing protein [Dactylosporangium sp. McL0621]|uniref:DUF6220 domain-containing protein n=1 Tax=Dactylosporangium sp. McL0621 TaxID=3415678 RepID=UPI003CEAE13D
MRKAFAGLAALFLLAVVIQFFLAASGAFNTAPSEESFRAHRALGYVIFLLAVVLVIVAAVARMSGRLIGMAGMVTGLVVLQVLIAVLARVLDTGDMTTTVGQLVFGLHGVNGLAIVALSVRILRQAQALASGPGVGPAPTAS